AAHRRARDVRGQASKRPWSAARAILVAGAIALLGSLVLCGCSGGTNARSATTSSVTPDAFGSMERGGAQDAQQAARSPQLTSPPIAPSKVAVETAFAAQGRSAAAADCALARVSGFFTGSDLDLSIAILSAASPTSDDIARAEQRLGVDPARAASVIEQ